MLKCFCDDPLSPDPNAEHWYTTYCGHLFHHICLINWLERSQTCPQCRKEVKPEEMIRVFPAAFDDRQEDMCEALEMCLEAVRNELIEKNAIIRNRERLHANHDCNSNRNYRLEHMALRSIIKTSDGETLDKICNDEDYFTEVFRAKMAEIAKEIEAAQQAPSQRQGEAGAAAAALGVQPQVGMSNANNPSTQQQEGTSNPNKMVKQAKKGLINIKITETKAQAGMSNGNETVKQAQAGTLAGNQKVKQAQVGTSKAKKVLKQAQAGALRDNNMGTVPGGIDNTVGAGFLDTIAPENIAYLTWPVSSSEEARAEVIAAGARAVWRAAGASAESRAAGASAESSVEGAWSDLGPSGAWVDAVPINAFPGTSHASIWSQSNTSDTWPESTSEGAWGGASRR